MFTRLLTQNRTLGGPHIATQGVQINPSTDNDGEPFEVEAGSIQPTVDDAEVLAKYAEADAALAQYIANRDGKTVEVNGVKYTPAQ